MTTKDNNEAASAPDLRAVLIEVQKALKIANETPGGPIRDTIWMPHEASETLFDFIEAALEAASASQSSTAGAAKGGMTNQDYSNLLANVARQRQESLTCPKCGADRLRGPCGNMEACGLTGTTYATPSAAVAEGVDTPTFRHHADAYALAFKIGGKQSEDTAECLNRLILYIDTYGAQQREAGRRERDAEIARLRARVEELIDICCQHQGEIGRLRKAALARQPMTASRPAGAASEGVTEKPEWRDLRLALAILMCGLSDKPVATCERVLEQAASNESGVIGQARAILSAVPPATQHPDDIAVDRFATAMKEKMAKSRAKGRGGWDDPAQCGVQDLAIMLVDHVEKGDPVDIGNFAMMLFNRRAWAGDLVSALSQYVLQQTRAATPAQPQGEQK